MAIETDRLTELQDFMFDTMASSEMAVDWFCDRFNVNADDAAVAICQLLNAELILLTDVNGVKGATGEYLTSLNYQQAKKLIDRGVIAGGMTAKVNAALGAANKLRRSIAVASWQSPEQIVDLLNGASIGTRIQPDGC